METEPGNGSILRNLAQDMLSNDENAQLRDALQKYRKSASLTSLVTQLTKVVTCTEKLMLLVELSNALPLHLKKDFHKLCCLHFPEYESFLTYFTPSTVGERSRIITQDPTGQFQVVSSGADDKSQFIFHKSDQTSLPGESGIDVNSDIDDICRHGDQNNNNGDSLGNTWRIESRSGRSNSTSSHVRRSTNNNTNNNMLSPKHALSGSQQLQQSWRHSQTSLPAGQENGTSIRNRARSLRVLSGSLPSVLASANTEDPRSDRKARILLKRHEDGSLGIGINGGKEYHAPIVVYLVEPGSQAAAQGLRVGDQILDVNGTDFSNITHAEAVMMMRNAWNIIMVIQRPDLRGTANSAQAYRWGQKACEEIDVLLYPSKKGKLGCGVYRDDHGYLIVKNVEKNSAASKAGLYKHDRFVEIDGIKVAGLTDKQVSALTNVKRMRIKIHRLTGSTSSSKGKGSRPKAPHLEFDSVLSLDLSPLGLADDDIVSSTPRRPAGRSHSEDRRAVKVKGHQPPVHLQQHQNNLPRGRSTSQAPVPRSSSGTDPASPPGAAAVVQGGGDETEEDTSMQVVTQTVKVDVHRSMISPRETAAGERHQGEGGDYFASNGVDEGQREEQIDRKEEDGNKVAGYDNVKLHRQDSDHSSELTPTPPPSPVTERRVSPVRRHNSQPRPQAESFHSHPHGQVAAYYTQHQQHYQHQYQQHQQHQARMYRPRMMQPSHPQQTAALHSKRSLARYMTSHGQNQPSSHSALPSRAAMLYSPTPFTHAVEMDRDRSRPKKRGVAHSASASSKMRQLRNKSQSPHAVHHNHQSRDREFLRAIQNSVERRQRAHRLSLYQLPDQDDDAWNIG